MLKGILSWFGAKTGAREDVRPAGGPLFEPLEPRLLLNADFVGAQPLHCEIASTDYAVYVDLDHQGTERQADVSPVLTVGPAACDETDQSAPTSAISEAPVGQAQCAVVAKAALSDSPAATQDVSAGPVIPAQQDIVLGSETPSIAIRGPPDLPGLRLIDPDPANLVGEIIYLDFDGEQNVTYNGPVTVGPFDVPTFKAPPGMAGQEQQIIQAVIADLQHTFAGSRVVFTTDKPAQGQAFSTIYIGGDDSAFGEYGSFLGLAEQVDVGDLDRGDAALVFSDMVAWAGPGNFATRLAGTVSHEVGHLLGYCHGDGLTGTGLLAGVAATGSISAGLRNVDGTTASSTGTRLVLYTSPAQTVSDSNPGRFVNIPVGTYLLEGYHTGTFFGEEFWTSQQVTVTANQTITPTLTRNYSYANGAVVKNDGTGAVIAQGQSIDVGTTVRVEITVKNDVPGTTLSSQVRLLIDASQSSPYDYDSGLSSAQSISGGGGTKVFTFRYMPTTAGQFYYALEVKTTLANSNTVRTDSWNWGKTFWSIAPDGAGNSPDAARDSGPLDGSVRFLDWIGTSDTNDYYKFSLAPHAEGWTFNLSLTGLSSDADVQLRDTDGTTVLAYSTAGGSSDERISRTLSGGKDYFVRVYPGVSGANTAYVLSVSATQIAPEDNAPNSRNRARDLGVVDGDLEIRDWVGTNDTDDYYKFKLASSAENWIIATILTGLIADADIQLLNSDGDVIWEGSNGGTVDESDNRTVGSSTYYLRVFQGSSSANTDYTLRLAVSPVGGLQTIFDTIDFDSGVASQIKTFVSRLAGATWDTIVHYLDYHIDFSANPYVGFCFGFEAKASVGEVIYKDIVEANVGISVLYSFGEDTWTISRGFEVTFDAFLEGVKLAGDEYLVVPGQSDGRPIFAGAELAGEWTTDVIPEISTGFKKLVDVTVTWPSLELGNELSISLEAALSQQEFLEMTGQSSLGWGIADSFGFAVSSWGEAAVDSLGWLSPVARPLLWSLSLLGLGDNPLGLMAQSTGDLQAKVEAKASVDANILKINLGVGASLGIGVSAGIFGQIVAGADLGTVTLWHQSFPRAELTLADDVGNTRVDATVLSPREIHS